MSRRVHIGLVVYGAVLAAAMVRINPALVGCAPRPTPTTPTAVFGGAPFRGRAAATLSAPTFVYRGSNARTGFDPVNPFTGPLKLAWQYGPVNAGIHAAAKSSPAVDSSGIYVGADTGDFYALDFKGALRWSFHVDNAPQGIHATAALDGDNAYFGDYKGRFYALRKDTGDLAWAIQLGETIGSSAAIVGPAIYICVERNHPFDGFVAKLDRRTGELQWMSSWLGDQSHASPTIDEARGALYVGANNGVLRALALDTGAERWRTQLEGAIKSTAVLVRDVIYVTSDAGHLYAVEVATGRIRWQVVLTGTAKGSPSYVPGEDLLVFGSNTGTGKHAAGGHVQAVRAADGSPVWSIPTDLGDMRASPTIVKSTDGSIAWTSCGEHAICALDARTGSIRQQLPLPAAFTGTPTLFEGRLYITLFDGGLFAFEP